MRRHRPGSSAAHDVVDVLIVEDDEDEHVAADDLRAVLHELALEAMAWRATWPGESRPLPGEDDESAEPPPGWAQRIARRYRRRALTGVVLAVAVAATTAVVDARQTAARAAALAAAPAVLADASGPPVEVWRMRGRVVSDLDDGLLVDDGVSLHGVDPATGELVWTASAAAHRAASSGGCFPVDESRRPDRAPAEPGAGPRGLVACGPPDAGHEDADGPAGADAPTADGPAPPGGAAADIVVLDPATGRTRHTVTPDGSLLLVEPAGRDLLVVAALPDGRVRATRWDLSTGTPRWDRTSAEPVLADGDPHLAQRRPDSVTVGTFAVDLTSGEVVDAELEGRQPYPYEEHTLPDGARATWSWRADGTSGRGLVGGGDHGRSFMLPGPPLRPPVSDGSHPHTLVVRTARGDRLRGVDLRSGRMTWTRPYPGASALRATALVDGVLLLDDGVTVTALDVGSGEDRWRTAVDPVAAGGAALTDGRHVLLAVRAGHGALLLVACRIADGTVVWRGELPSEVLSLTVVDHHLVAATDDEVLGLGGARPS